MKTKNLDSGEFTDSLSYVDIGQIVRMTIANRTDTMTKMVMV